MTRVVSALRGSQEWIVTVCRRVVEAHGGRIWVEAADGGGSDFCLTVPH